MSESSVKIEEGTLVGYRVQGAQRNRDGSELEGPRVFFVLKFPLERVEAHLGTFARLIKRDRVIKFTELRFIEQLEFEAMKPAGETGKKLTDQLGTFPAAAANGHDNGKARDVVAAGLTLDDVGGEIGKQGGQKWSPSGVRFRVGSREYGERDTQKSFSDLGIGTTDLIEVLEPVGTNS